MADSTAWPELAIADWSDTRDTLHRWTQVVGKVRTTLMPWFNHSWACTLYVTPRGLSTLSVPHGPRSMQIDFDLLGHRLTVVDSTGAEGGFALEPMSVADFYNRLMTTLENLGLGVTIHGRPNEVEDNVPFAEDTQRAAYDAPRVAAFQTALSSADRVMQRFRAGFRGKCSPVHFFWGSFDLAVTRFSGREAPTHPGGFPNMPDWITREAYSHEVSSCGFWPGGDGAEAMFYAYAYPTPDGFKEGPIQPAGAAWNNDLGEFVLLYEAVRTSSDPESDLLAFLQTSYEAAANRAEWDRKALEWDGPQRQ